ncbi:2-amino-4-hydroxy-6-hydroxymethyldihydropteridine diphosphokinase [Aliikangiella coralliicola]|uniref:2-amino-4-hydroxy-6- hydroxymethyldihydropteridine diphosphokinase n=1 Tax=Aliikangiella coralliicola TaxID=2592383 RepID=UPI00143D84E9|nr:2-amino-4-hydroxy-6-hydroxymethyldihydropteridine diphosphokinase [Aliikangiella coralliicola]
MIVYLGIGSNIDAKQNVSRTKLSLTNRFPQAQFSRTFESEAVGFEGDNFLNLVAKIETDESLDDLLATIKNLEDELGRVRGGEKFSSRHIDIDILIYGDLVCDNPIILPREEVNLNAYVLWPLAELAPDLVEPGGVKTYSQLWSEFDKKSQKLRPID